MRLRSLFQPRPLNLSDKAMFILAIAWMAALAGISITAAVLR